MSKPLIRHTAAVFRHSENSTTDTFKRRLEKFWQHQHILYDYKVELTGVGNRSQINADDNFVI